MVELYFPKNVTAGDVLMRIDINILGIYKREH
jgi:hypothetical protein